MSGLLKYRLPLILPTVIVLLGALLALALLQYRWLGEVSMGERERMKTALHAGAQRFSEDFDRELARAYLTFQIDGETLRSHRWSAFAERYALWQKSAPYPQLLGESFLAWSDEHGPSPLQRFNRSSNRFEICDWPPYLSPVREQFAQLVNSSASERPKNVLPVTRVIGDDHPTLVIPVADTPRIEKAAERSRTGVVFQKQVD